MKQARALILFSGGQDSTTCLAWALERFSHVETLGFDYNQRHKIELNQRAIIRDNLSRMKPEWAGRLGPDHTLALPILGEISETALTRETAITFSQEGLPSTFVPGRNLVFLTFAAALAYRRGLDHIVGGMCETDYSGYPDCRDETIKAMEKALCLGLDRKLTLHTPLMWLSKAQSWNLVEELGGHALIDLVIEDTHTCYLGTRGKRHEWGHGCGTCPACQLRAEGYHLYTKTRSSSRADP